jgi:hypothetical protein
MYTAAPPAARPIEAAARVKCSIYH